MTKWRYELARPAKPDLKAEALIKFVEANPGMTATMIARCLGRNPGTVSSALHKLVKAHRLSKIKSKGMVGGKVEAWRYHEDVAKAAVNAVMETTT